MFRLIKSIKGHPLLNNKIIYSIFDSSPQSNLWNEGEEEDQKLRKIFSQLDKEDSELTP